MLLLVISFVISQNKCNKFMSLSITQQHRIRIDPPNTAVGPKNWCKCTVSHGLHHVLHEHGSRDAIFPGNMERMMPCSPGTWCCTDETGQRCLFLHITRCALDQSRLRNSDPDITKLYLRQYKTQLIVWLSNIYRMAQNKPDYLLLWFKFCISITKHVSMIMYM